MAKRTSRNIYDDAPPTAVKDPSDPELAQFAKDTLPTLKEHKALAEKLPGQ